VRSRNHDQEPGSEAEQSQPVSPPDHAAAPQQPAQLPQAAVTDRSDPCAWAFITCTTYCLQSYNVTA
jgi:hypothetical protein